MKIMELKQFPENLNLSFYLLLPLIFEDYTSWWSLLEEDYACIYNGYIYDKNSESTENSFVLAVDPEMSNQLGIKKFIENKNFIKKYSGRFTINKKFEILDVYSFSIEDKYMDTYEKIKVNDYFGIDIEIKKKILSFWNATFNSKLYDYLLVSAIENIKVSDEVLTEKSKDREIAAEIANIDC